jgi:hypothetical protein
LAAARLTSAPNSPDTAEPTVPNAITGAVTSPSMKLSRMPMSAQAPPASAPPAAAAANPPPARAP